MSINVDEVRSALLTSISNDQLILPTLPEIGLKVQEAANDPDTDITQLNGLVGTDAALSARIIKVANSPLVRGQQVIDDLRTALSRLGVTYACNLALGLAMEQMFQATNEIIDERLRLIWSRSTEVAAIASVLAQHYTKLAPDQATLAGLTHLIGVLPILTYLEESDIEITTSDNDQLDSLIEALSPQIGQRILSAWKFPLALVNVPAQHHDYLRESPEVDFTDVVIVAKLQSYGASISEVSNLDWSTIPAFRKLGLSVEEQTLELNQLGEDLHLAAVALQ